MILELALVLALAQADAPAVRELTRTVHELAATWQKGDCAAWEAIVAPEWAVTHVTGAMITREQAVEMCRTPPMPIETFEIDEIKVRVFGDAAVVTGRTRVTTGGANPAAIALRFTDVFIRRGNRWQAVASQATTLGGG